MDIFDPGVRDPEALKKWIQDTRRYLDALERAADIGMGAKNVESRAIYLIEDYLRENGPQTEDELVLALKDKLFGRENPVAEIKKSVRAAVRHGRLIEKDGKIHLPA